MRKIAPEERAIKRKSYVKKLMHVVRNQGFTSLNIQDIARSMNMSRASLYNYFSSKEEIIKEVTEYYIAYFREADATISDQSLSYPYRLQKVFEQAVLSAFYASDIFMRDLKQSCPALYEKKMLSRTERSATLHSFYQEGMKAGVFNELNPAILILQDDATLKEIIDSECLKKKGLSLKQALVDYYEAKKFQVFKVQSLKEENAGTTEGMVEDILYKIHNTL